MNEQYLGRLTDLEKNIGYTFKDKNLLLEAVTHSSFANERKINKLRCNERLEFLGDAVLEIISSDYLFRRFADLPEGKLSKMRSALVCEPALFECSHAIKLSDFILLGKGEDNGGGRTGIDLNQPHLAENLARLDDGDLLLVRALIVRVNTDLTAEDVIHGGAELSLAEDDLVLVECNLLHCCSSSAQK